MISFLSDIINYLYILFFLYYLFISKNLDKDQFLLLAIACLSPIFMFDFLFKENSKYFGDVWFYSWSFEKAKYFYYDQLYHTKDIQIASVIYSFIPIPFFNSSNSLGFICKILFIFIIIFMNKFKIHKYYSYLVILLPSSILYTSVGTKDTLVLFAMVLGFIGIVRNKFFLIFIPLIILLTIRFQNGIFFLFIYLSYQVLFNRSLYTFLSGTAILAIFTYPFTERIKNNFNMQALNNFYRDFRYQDGIPTDQIGTLSILKQNIFFYVDDFIMGNINFFLSPTIFNFTNFFQLAQALENIFIIFIFLLMFVKLIKINLYKCLFWYSHLFIVAGLYGLIISNAGTLVRLKFSIVISFLIILFYESNKNKLRLKS